MISEKKLATLLVGSVLINLWLLLICVSPKEELKHDRKKIIELTAKVDSLQNSNDSLQSELLPVEIELGRYQVAYQIFLERNPKAASQLGEIISNETE